MKIALWSMGKSHDPMLKQGIEEFTTRIHKYFPVEWNIIPSPKNAALLDEPTLKKAEAQAVLALLQKEDVLILLDERGKNISSPELAQLIQQKANSSVKRLIFLIGGAFGADPTLQQRADFMWSLSKLVFPHMIVRLILAEQIYRACSILRNEKYHHS